MSPGTLYVVGTPIGNLEDITLRALRILKAVDLVACEDTRRTRGLLSHFDVHVPVTSYFEHNKLRKGEVVLRMLAEGRSVALVSDAGTPAISDPGVLLVRQARAAGIPVVPVPGASAVATALSAAGLPADRFVFDGFLPVKPAGDATVSRPCVSSRPRWCATSRPTACSPRSRRSPRSSATGPWRWRASSPSSSRRSSTAPPASSAALRRGPGARRDNAPDRATPVAEGPTVYT